MSGEHEGHGPELPAAHDLHRSRERALEADQAGAGPDEVAQAKASAKQTEAAYGRAADREMNDAAYRAEVEASYDGDRYADLEAGT